MTSNRITVYVKSVVLITSICQTLIWTYFYYIDYTSLPTFGDFNTSVLPLSIVAFMN